MIGAFRKKPVVSMYSLARAKASISGNPLTSSADFLLPVCSSSRARYCSKTLARTPSISTAIVFMQVPIECQVAASAAANRTVRGADKGEGKPITEELESNYDWACWTSPKSPLRPGVSLPKRKDIYSGG